MTPAVTHEPRLSRPTLAMILFWLAVWAFTLLTWMYGDDGYTYGMAPAATVLTMLGPLLVGLVLGWNKATLWPAVRAGMIGGALFGAATMVGQLVWGGVLYLLGRIPPDAMEEMGGLPVMIFEVIEFTVLFVVSGLILGAIGGAAARLINHFRRGREE